MLESAARRRAWPALVGVTIVEGAALAWIFHAARWDRIAHYLFVPPGNAVSWAAGLRTRCGRWMVEGFRLRR